MGQEPRFPARHADYLARCHAAGQRRPTPLLLKYGEGDYNYLHQDLCGEHVFPRQLTVMLSEPGRDFTGGEFVLTEQRPRMQSRPAVVSLAKGDAVLFAVRHRPVQGTRGSYRVNLRHGVSRLRSGNRQTPRTAQQDKRACSRVLKQKMRRTAPEQGREQDVYVNDRPHAACAPRAPPLPLR